MVEAVVFLIAQEFLKGGMYVGAEEVSEVLDAHGIAQEHA